VRLRRRGHAGVAFDDLEAAIEREGDTRVVEGGWDERALGLDELAERLG